MVGLVALPLRVLDLGGFLTVDEINYWIDRDHDLVGAYYEVTTRVSADFNLLWNFDLFQNAITAAVDD